MSPFIAGFLSAIGCYFAIGVLIGIYVVATHLALFFAAGWQWKRMAGAVFANTIGWPATLFDIIYQAIFLRRERQFDRNRRPEPLYEDPDWVEAEDVEEPFVRANVTRGSAVSGKESGNG